MAQYGHHDHHFGAGKDVMHGALGSEVYGSSHSHHVPRPDPSTEIGLQGQVPDTNHILTNNDSQLMNTFFSDPNNFAANFNPDMNASDPNRDFATVFGYQSFTPNGVRPQEMPRPPPFPPHNHAAGAHNNGNNGQNEGDDMSAASQLVNMAHAGPARGHNPQTQTWTHLDSSGTTHAGIPAHGAMAENARRASNSFFAPSMQAFNEFASQQQVQARNNVQSARSAGLVEPRHEPLRQPASQPVEVTHTYRPIEPGEAVAFFTALPPSTNNSKGSNRAPVLFSFGSDNSFSMAGYRGQLHGMEPRDKAGNLLNIPGAGPVAGQEGPAENVLESNFPPRVSERAHLNHMTFPVENNTDLSKTRQNGLPYSEKVQHNVPPPTNPLKRRNTDIEFTHVANFSDPLAGYNARKRHHSVAQYSGVDHAVDGASMSRVSQLPTISDDPEENGIMQQFARPGIKRTRTDPQDPDTPQSQGSDAEASSPQQGGSSKKKARENKSRPNLTESQKRENHIISEQKRRNVIKQAFNDLNSLIPTLQGGKSGLSKAEVLKEVVNYLTSLVEGNKRMDSFLNGLEGASGSNERHIPAY